MTTYYDTHRTHIETYMSNYRAMTGRDHFKRISRDDLSELVVKAQGGDKQAFDMVAAQTFIYAMQRINKTRSHMRSKMDDEDILQHAMIGVIEAVKRFDITLGFSFLTYCTWWIKQSIDRGMMNDCSNIRIPVHIYGKFRDMMKAYREAKKLDDTLKEPHNLSLEKMKELLPDQSEEIYTSISIHFFNRYEIRLDKDFESENGEDGRNGYESFNEDHSDLIIDESEQMVDLLHTIGLSDILITALGMIPAKERFILIRRFGLLNGDEQTLEEIGQLMKLTRERIRQIESNALRQLKGAILNANSGKLPSVGQLEKFKIVRKQASNRIKPFVLSRDILREEELEIMSDALEEENQDEHED